MTKRSACQRVINRMIVMKFCGRLLKNQRWFMIRICALTTMTMMLVGLLLCIGGGVHGHLVVSTRLRRMSAFARPTRRLPLFQLSRVVLCKQQQQQLLLLLLLIYT